MNSKKIIEIKFGIPDSDSKNIFHVKSKKHYESNPFYKKITKTKLTRYYYNNLIFEISENSKRVYIRKIKDFKDTQIDKNLWIRKFLIEQIPKDILDFPALFNYDFQPDTQEIYSESV